MVDSILTLVGILEYESFNFSIQKEGIDVVNFSALTAIAGQKDTIIVSMASREYLSEFRRKIYEVGVTKLEKTLKIKIQQTKEFLFKELQETLINENRIKELKGLYDQLLREYDKIEERARDLSSKYSKINLDALSDLYQKTFKSFIVGDFDSALKILRATNLKEYSSEILTEKEKISKIAKEIKLRDSLQKTRTAELMPALRLKADIHKLRYEFDSVEVAYSFLLQLDSSNVENLWEYALFL